MVVYTFRTFPQLDDLRQQFEDVVVLSKLKDDLAGLERHIMTTRPEYVLGVASTKGPSRFEPIAVNVFNHGRVIKDAPDQLSLYVPARSTEAFSLAKRPTYSFCNWSMYRLQYFLVQNAVPTKLLFVHLNKSDLPRLRPMFTNLNSKTAQ